MARLLANKANVQAPDSDYPYGRAKDNPGNNTGTNVNENLLGDILQFFEKMFAESGLTANELPDNEYSGFQLFEALQEVIRIRVGGYMSIIEIGDWDMDATGNINVSTGIATDGGVGFSVIKNVTAIIRPDSGSVQTLRLLNSWDDSADDGTVNGGVGAIGTSGTINLRRKSGGHFDSTTYNQTSYNRGWLIVTYSKDDV